MSKCYTLANKPAGGRNPWFPAIVVSFPNHQNPQDNPLQLRPITVLSSLYRIWAKIRAQEIASHWQETWIHTGARGGRIRQGAETVIFEVMADLETDTATHFCGGLSLIWSKLSTEYFVDFFQNSLTNGVTGHYSQAPYWHAYTRHSQIQAQHVFWPSVSNLWWHLTGCPLSMICMSVITNIWLHKLDDLELQCRPRA